MSEHFIERCKCGIVVRQCRCAVGLGEVKHPRIVPCTHQDPPVTDQPTALRLTLAQQAQELDEIKGLLGCHRAYVLHTIQDMLTKAEQQEQEIERLTHEKKDLAKRNQMLRTRPDLPMTHDDKALFKQREHQLAVMAAERDEAIAVGRKNAEKFADAAARHQIALAAREAEIVRLETENDLNAWKISPAMAQAKIDELNETIAKRETEIAQLNNVLRQAGWGHGEIDSAAYTFDQLVNANTSLVQRAKQAEARVRELEDQLNAKRYLLNEPL